MRKRRRKHPASQPADTRTALVAAVAALPAITKHFSRSPLSPGFRAIRTPPRRPAAAVKVNPTIPHSHCGASTAGALACGFGRRARKNGEEGGEGAGKGVGKILGVHGVRPRNPPLRVVGPDRGDRRAAASSLSWRLSSGLLEWMHFQVLNDVAKKTRQEPS